MRQSQEAVLSGLVGGRDDEEAEAGNPSRSKDESCFLTDVSCVGHDAPHTAPSCSDVPASTIVQLHDAAPVPHAPLEESRPRGSKARMGALHPVERE